MISIDLRVNGTDKLREAKKEVGFLNDSLRDTRELGEITIAPKGMSEFVNEMKQVGSETRTVISGISEIAAEMRRLSGVRFNTPELADSIRQTQILNRSAAPRQPSQQRQPEQPQQAGEPVRRSLYERVHGRRQEAKPEPVEKPQSHYDALIKVPPTVSERTEQAAQEQPAPTQQRQARKPVEPASRPEHRKSVIPPTVSERTEQAAANAGEQNQWPAVERGVTKTAAALAAAQKQSAKLKEDLKHVLQDMKGIEKASHDINLQPGTRATMMTEILSLEARKSELEKDIAKTDKRVETLQTRQTANNQVQQERGTVSDRNGGNDSGGRNGGQFMRRAMGWGMAAAGIGSIAAYVAASRSSYRTAVDEESPLYAKGLTGSRSRASMAAGMGINPGEYYHMEDSLSRTGITEKNMAKNAMMTTSFSKFAGLDTAEVAGLRSNLYSATGSNETIPNSVILAMSDATKKGMDKARLPELLGLIGRNTNATAQAMHGAGVDSQQIGAITRLSVAALALKDSTSYKPFAKSEAFQQNVMQHGLRGAGSGAGEIKLFQAMGGFDGPMSYEKIHKLNLTKQGGFMQNPELLTKIIGGLSSTTKEGRAGELASLMPDWKIEGKASEKLVEMFESGFLKKLSANKGQTIESMAKGGDQEAKRWLEEIGKNPALGRQAQESKADIVKIQAGEQLSALFLPLEKAATEMAGSLASGDWKKSFSILDKAAGEMGTVGKIFVTGAGLIAAGGAMNMIGGAMSMGKGGIGALGMLAGPGGILAALGLGGIAAVKTFSGGAQGANYLPADRLNAITGKPPSQPTSFGGKLNPEVANNPRLSPGYKKHAVKIHEAAKKHGVPEPLLAGLIESESDFKNVPPRSVKMKNGKSISVGGVSQLTDSTAKQLKVDKMDPGQAIDGAARLLSDLHKKTGDWRESVKQYKGVQSKETEPQADAAFMKAEKYVRTEPERQTLQAAAGGGSDPMLQMLYDVLKNIAESSKEAAANSRQTMTARILKVAE